MISRVARIRVAAVFAVAFAVAAVLVQTGNTTRVDDAILYWAASLRTPSATGIVRVVTFFGSGNFLFPLGVAVTIWIRRSSGARLSWYYLGWALAGWASYGLFKYLFARPRPNLIPRLGSAGWWSFPSGHAMGTTIVVGLALCLLPLRTWHRVVISLGVVAIACSRVYLGVHYPSDVIAGVLAGVAFVALALVWLPAETPVLRAE
jgi:membrane-associated phospholipid phosphatase